MLEPSPTPGQVAPRPRAGQATASRRQRRAGAHTLRARLARAACTAAGQPAGPSEVPQPPTHATHSLLPRIRSGAAQSRPNAFAVTTGRSSPVRPTVHPLLEFKHHISLHPHPLDPPVHVHWPADPPACPHCGRGGRPPPSSPPTVAGAVSCQADPTNRPRVSPTPP
jgi:hypothetical protein